MYASVEMETPGTRPARSGIGLPERRVDAVDLGQPAEVRAQLCEHARPLARAETPGRGLGAPVATDAGAAQPAEPPGNPLQPALRTHFGGLTDPGEGVIGVDLQKQANTPELGQGIAPEILEAHQQEVLTRKVLAVAVELGGVTRSLDVLGCKVLSKHAISVSPEFPAQRFTANRQSASSQNPPTRKPEAPPLLHPRTSSVREPVAGEHGRVRKTVGDPLAVQHQGQQHGSRCGDQTRASLPLLVGRRLGLLETFDAETDQ